jgi:hypothetical protein
MGKALLFAVCCALWLSPSAHAYGYYITMSYAKPNTPWLVFFEDRNECLWSSQHSSWQTVGMAGSIGGGLSGGGAVVTTSYNVRTFTNCMSARGYHFDANGYRAVWIHQRNDGRYWMGGF